MAIPVVIITGFLGCGKTSFLRNLLPLCGEAKVRPALIINEVGTVDVDGECLADLHAEQVRLVGGCICCTLQSQLTGTVYDVLEREACDLIIIECSGLSNPMDVVAALSAPALLRQVAVSHIVCLMDSTRIAKVLKVAELARTQVSSADILILNKADKLTDDGRPAVEAELTGLWEQAETHWASYGDIGRENLMRILDEHAPAHCACGCGHDHDHHHDHGIGNGHSHSLPASFCTVAVPLPDAVGRPEIESVLGALPENVIRAKGFANVESEGWKVLHRVYDSTDIMTLSGPAPSIGAVLVCIGQHISYDEIMSAVSRCLVNAECGVRNAE